LTSIIRETVTKTRRLLPQALGSGLVAVLGGFAGAVAIAVARHSDAVAELAVIYIPVMILPFVAATIAVLPVMALAHTIISSDQRWLLSLIGVALAPVQGLFWLTVGHLLFSRDPPRSTLAADLAVALAHPADTAPLLIALAAGGLVLGMLAARTGSGNRAQLAG
jgi:hypothetical protein